MSIRHIVMWRLGTQDPAEKQQQISEIRDALEALHGVVPTLRSITVGINALFVGANFDLVLETTFDDAEGLAAYAVHPAHVAAGEIVKKYTVERSAVDYEF